MQLSEPGSRLFRTPVHSASKICVLLLSWSSTSCGVLRKGSHGSCHTYIHRDIYFTLETENQKRNKKEKKIFAEDYGLKGDPRLLAISQAIRVVSQSRLWCLGSSMVVYDREV
ncbi:uncharacterized protein DS421_12g358330 [Arachis hypogaea]|nr:uncharacterized protein DS421_12g358330 [Arachis hypogaea]